jgi:pilus assembly protein CpaC
MRSGLFVGKSEFRSEKKVWPMIQAIHAAILILFLLTSSQIMAQGETSHGGLNGTSRTAISNQMDIPPQIPLPAPGGEQTLRVFTGKSIVLKSGQPFKRVSLSDPAIATALTVAPDQVLIHGLKPGSATLILWDDQESPQSFELQVRTDIRILRDSLQAVFPQETIQVTQSGLALVLTGEVSNQLIADRALALAQTESAAVVNMLRTRPQASDIIMLQVRFAEVDRTAIQEFAVNFLSTGAGNTLGAVTTGQIGQLSTNAGAVPSDVSRGKDPQQPNLVSGGIGNPLRGMPAVFGLSDLLNIFLFRPDMNLGITVKALQQQNLLQVLAEPNLLAMSGKEASFLAGGEFPFPVVQPGAGFSAVTIMFKEFGVRLKFTASLQEQGTIRLKVNPEVSSLDFSNALTISGFVVPALSTRRTETEVELKDGQSFAIAGLIDNRLNEVASKIPWLGDVPIIGKFFRSRATNKTNTELMVLVTPTVVKPLNPGQLPPLPKFPLPFMDKEKFEGKAGEKTIKPSSGKH